VDGKRRVCRRSDSQSPPDRYEQQVLRILQLVFQVAEGFGVPENVARLELIAFVVLGDAGVFDVVVWLHQRGSSATFAMRDQPVGDVVSASEEFLGEAKDGFGIRCVHGFFSVNRFRSYLQSRQACRRARERTVDLIGAISLFAQEQGNEQQAQLVLDSRPPGKRFSDGEVQLVRCAIGILRIWKGLRSVPRVWLPCHPDLRGQWFVASSEEHDDRMVASWPTGVTCYLERCRK